MEERFEPRTLESFDPVTQEIYQLLPEMIHNNPTIQSAKENRGAECLTLAPEDSTPGAEELMPTGDLRNQQRK
jgi:hypothetical protein